VLRLFTGTRRDSRQAERRAQQLIAASFDVLALYVSIEAARTLANDTHPPHKLGRDRTRCFHRGNDAAARPGQRSPRKRAALLGNRNEASQTRLCAYLSIALLLGLAANAPAGWSWADPLAAFFIAAVAAKEGRQSWRGAVPSGSVPAREAGRRHGRLRSRGESS
jgi:hypothetical protein